MEKAAKKRASQRKSLVIFARSLDCARAEKSLANKGARDRKA